MKAMRNVAVVAAISILTCSGAALAQGGNGKAYKTQARNGAGTGTSTQSAGTSVVRPEGSQRRDGTFLTTGVTANGSTTRPSKGNGLQDGSGLTTTTTDTPVSTVTQ